MASFVTKIISELSNKNVVSDTDIIQIADSSGNMFKATWAKIKEWLLGTKDISGVGDGSVTGAIKELGTKTDYPVTYSNICSNQTSSFVSTIQRYGKIITICGNLKSTTQFSTTYQTVMTLPKEIRPASEIWGPAVIGKSEWNSTKQGMVRVVPSTGIVVIYCPGTAAENAALKYAKFCISYCIP